MGDQPVKCAECGTTESPEGWVGMSTWDAETQTWDPHDAFCTYRCLLAYVNDPAMLA